MLSSYSQSGSESEYRLTNGLIPARVKRLGYWQAQQEQLLSTHLNCGGKQRTFCSVRVCGVKPRRRTYGQDGLSQLCHHVQGYI